MTRSLFLLLFVMVGLLFFGSWQASQAFGEEHGEATAVSPNTAILEDFSDIVTQSDMGFNDFGGNMGSINDSFVTQMALNCTEDGSSCGLHFSWDFGQELEQFTGIFHSLFGLLQTQTTYDGTTIESIHFPEHTLDLDNIDGALNEPGGPRTFEQLCFELTYKNAADLQLRLEMKDAVGGIRFTRFFIPSNVDPQSHCWDFRTDFTIPGGVDLDIHNAKELTLIIERVNIGDGIENPATGTFNLNQIWFVLNREETMPDSNEARLDLLERRSYQYFLDWSSRKPESMDIPQDRSTFGDLLSMGGVGFGLPAHVIAAERGWISREDAAQRVLNILRVLDDPDAFGPEPMGNIGYKGWFYHFLGVNGRRKLNFDFPETPVNEALNTVELSTIDTSLAILGAQSAQSYFDQADNPLESEIRQRAQSIYDRVEWSFMLEPKSQQFYLGWKPNELYEGPAFDIPDADGLGGYSGTIGHPATLDFYTDEALMAIILGVGSETHPVSPETYNALITQPDESGLVRTYPGALFTYQFLQSFLDTRTTIDCHPINWYNNSRQAIWRVIAYAEENPLGFTTYGPDAWGISAAEGPFDEYHAYGAQTVAQGIPSEEDGTVTYYGMGSAAGFGSDLYARVETAVAAAWNREHWHPRFGLPDAFNDEISEAHPPESALRKNGPWVNRALFGIDQGPMLLHLENARSGLIWQLTAQNPNVQRGLKLIQQQKIGQGESGTGDGTIMPRANAWEEKTIWLNQNESRAWTFNTSAGSNATIAFRYSNDNFGPLETVQITLDDVTIGEFTAQDTGDNGEGWDIFEQSEPITIDDITSGPHTLAVTVEGGDGFGVEIDAFLVQYYDDPTCLFTPFVTR